VRRLELDDGQFFGDFGDHRASAGVEDEVTLGGNFIAAALGEVPAAGGLLGSHGLPGGAVVDADVVLADVTRLEVVPGTGVQCGVKIFVADLHVASDTGSGSTTGLEDGPLIG